MFGNEDEKIPENGAPPPRLLYSIPEVAHVLGGLTTRYVYDLVGDGRLRSVKVGRRRLVPVEALKEYIAQLDSTPSGAA